MGFQKKTWKDRIVEFAGRRTLTKVAGSVDGNLVVDVARNEGLVSQAGDAYNASNMNDLEQRIADAIGTGNIPEELGGDIISAISKLNTDMGWIKVWENENASLAGLTYPGKTISLNLDDYSEFRVIFYINGKASNITVNAELSPRSDGRTATAIASDFNREDNGISIDYRTVVYDNVTHTLDIRNGFRWKSNGTLLENNFAIKPAYIEAR